VSDDIDEMHGDETGTTAAFAVCADASQMMCIAQPEAHDTGRLHALDRKVGRLTSYHLSEAELSIDQQYGAAVADDVCVGIRVQMSDANVANVRGCHTDAV